MNLLRVDYFKKVSAKHKRATLCGGILSVLSVGLIAALLLTQIYAYWINPRVLKISEVQSEFEATGLVDLNIDIMFEHAPCNCECLAGLIEVISVFLDYSSSHTAFIGDSFKKQRISGTTHKPISNDYVNPIVRDHLPRNTQRDWLYVITGILDKQWCRVSGTSLVQSVPGVLLFSYKGFQIPLIMLHDQLDLDLSHLNYKHQIKSLTFGNLSYIDRK